MAVLIVTTQQVRPGRRQDVLKNLAELKKLVEKHGGNARIWQSDMAGQNYGNVSATLEFDDYASFAKYQQATAADSEFQALIARRQADTNPPGTIVSRVSYTEVVL